MYRFVLDVTDERISTMRVRVYVRAPASLRYLESATVLEATEHGRSGGTDGGKEGEKEQNTQEHGK